MISVKKNMESSNSLEKEISQAHEHYNEGRYELALKWYTKGKIWC